MHPIVEFEKRINHFGVDEKFGAEGVKSVDKSGKPKVLRSRFGLLGYAIML